MPQAADPTGLPNVGRIPLVQIGQDLANNIWSTSVPCRWKSGPTWSNSVQIRPSPWQMLPTPNQWEMLGPGREDGGTDTTPPPTEWRRDLGGRRLQGAKTRPLGGGVLKRIAAGVPLRPKVRADVCPPPPPDATLGVGNLWVRAESAEEDLDTPPELAPAHDQAMTVHEPKRMPCAKAVGFSGRKDRQSRAT